MSKKGKVKEPCEVDRSVPKKKKRRAKDPCEVDCSGMRELLQDTDSGQIVFGGLIDLKYQPMIDALVTARKAKLIEYREKHDFHIAWNTHVSQLKRETKEDLIGMTASCGTNGFRAKESCVERINFDVGLINSDVG